MPRPIEAEDLFRLKLVGDAQISPDGCSVAYVIKELDRDKNDYVSNIYLWRDGESRQYTSGGKDSSPRWSPDGRWLAFLSGREEKGQIYLMRTDGGEPVRLTDQKLGARTPVWSPDSCSLAFAGPVPFGPEKDSEDDTPKTRIIDRAVYKMNGSGFIEDRRTHVFVADVETREVRQITDGDFNDAAPTWSPDGAHIAFSSNRDPEWDLQSASAVWVVPREGGDARRVTAPDGMWTSPVFSPQGDEIACIGYSKSRDGESTYYPQLFVFSRGGGEGRNLLKGTDLAVGNSVGADWSAAGEDGLVWTEAGIDFLVSRRGTSNIYRWSEAGLTSCTEGRHNVMDFSVSGDHTAYTVSDATHPGEIYLDGVRITGHNCDALKDVQVAVPEHLTFTGANDVEIDGWLMRPVPCEEGKRYPLIVYIHGGPVSAYGESFFHEFQALAGAGFGVFFCNPHGSSSVGQQFQVSIMGAWGTVDYEDVMAGVDRVLQEEWVDAHRLGVAGGSYGGFMVNWIVGHTDRFAAAVTERSICNMVSQGGTSDWAATRGERLLATPEGDPEKLWSMSPLKYVSNVKTPVLVVHSERDDRCPIEEGEQWYMALKRRRVPTRFIRFPEENHDLSRNGKPSRRLERLGYITGWFREWL